MSARVLNARSSLISLLGEIRYTLSRLQANPLTTAHAPAFQALRDEWTPTLNREISINEAISDAQALIDAADDTVDNFASRLSKAILTITRDDRSHTVYTHFFGNKSLSEFRRPVLGAQLEAMRPWADSLVASPHPSLTAMAKELIPLIASADKAIAARDKARQQNKEFRDVGERRHFVDKLNATRKATHGTLAKLPFESIGLPTDFADHFFRREGRDEEEAAPTIQTVNETITALTAELTAQNELLAKLTTEAADLAKATAQRQTDENELAGLKQQMAEMAKKAEELSQKLGKK